MHCNDFKPLKTSLSCENNIANENERMDIALAECRGNEKCTGILHIKASNSIPLNFRGMHKCESGGNYFALCKEGSKYILNPTSASTSSHGRSSVGQKFQLGGKLY